MKNTMFMFLPWEEAVSNVSWEVDTETDGDDESVAGDHVNGQVPEVHEPGNLRIVDHARTRQSKSGSNP